MSSVRGVQRGARRWYPRAQAPFAVRWLVTGLAGVDEAMARDQQPASRDVRRRTRVPPARCRSGAGIEVFK
jgi:hypothetical protein